ncbi:hypothetical protein CXG81DRAFT_11156 [Caulochytrium protostelioides]|uniref:Cyclin N-terminal domain-containing protein n=1 Tax=Caulochytrium protostelioides TaxID=1555241 RepID=A0A4P9XAK3_9FUNG|nr:hypothetical protein CXG81DRAFT_11156 [Caulochytrium protostelioides]|eukprot:RKP02121.1 hypothetical protein CXG81DRAFT_11156 [Caulochytrium protostelioides]
MNEQFRVEHPELDPDITLTKIRKMKSCILLIARSTGMDLSTVAYAYAYFEKLVVKRVVTKANRRVIAATCLLLAAKINEPRELNYRKINSAAGKIMDISPKEIAKNEFSIYTSLSFSLFLGPWQVMPHLERIQAATLSQQR